MLIETGGFLWSLIKENTTPQNHEKAQKIMRPELSEEFAKFFDANKVKYITDDLKGLLILSQKGFYECLDMILDDEEFTVVSAMEAGHILASRSEFDKRWLICSCKAESWGKLRQTINMRLKFLPKERVAWRTLNRHVVQLNGSKFICPEDVVFKICRIPDAKRTEMPKASDEEQTTTEACNTVSVEATMDIYRKLENDELTEADLEKLAPTTLEKLYDKLCEEIEERKQAALWHFGKEIFEVLAVIVGKHCGMPSSWVSLDTSVMRKTTLISRVRIREEMLREIASAFQVEITEEEMENLYTVEHVLDMLLAKLGIFDLFKE